MLTRVNWPVAQFMGPGQPLNKINAHRGPSVGTSGFHLSEFLVETIYIKEKLKVYIRTYLLVCVHIQAESRVLYIRVESQMRKDGGTFGEG